MNGQRIASIADLQWVLHNLPNTDTHVEIETSATGKHNLALKAGWKQTDFSWRGSMWNAPPRLEVWLPPVSAEVREKLAIPDEKMALEVRWINRQGKAGQQAYNDGLREKDVVIAAAGQSTRMDTRQLQQHVKLNYNVGDVLPVTVLRDGKQKELTIRLVD
jgi:hypothetical protein